TAALEDQLRDTLVGGVVLGDEDAGPAKLVDVGALAPAGEARLRSGVRRRELGGQVEALRLGDRKVELDPEQASLARRAHDADLASHQLHEVPRDRRPEAGPAVDP